MSKKNSRLDPTDYRRSIYKADVPVRPIVSCVNSFPYDLSAYLANILSPLTGSTDFMVNNSAHFVSTTRSERTLDNEIMVSFDVESLFTNVPIDAAVEAALQKLENDPGLADRSTLTHLFRSRTFWTSYLDPHSISITDQFTNNSKAQPWEARFLLLHGEFLLILQTPIPLSFRLRFRFLFLIYTGS